MIKIEAMYLQVGDITPMGETIISVRPSIIPRDQKIFLTLKDAKGNIRETYWHKYTRVRVTR